MYRIGSLASVSTVAASNAVSGWSTNHLGAIPTCSITSDGSRVS